MSKKPHIDAADLQGFATIIKDATLHITHLVEEVQHTIVHPPFLASSPLQHLITAISSISYKSVRYFTNLIAKGLELSLSQSNQVMDIRIAFEKKETMLSILNGIIGDYLCESNNPLAISMQFRYHGENIAQNKQEIHTVYPKTNGKILLLIHGLCMNDILWHRCDHDHGEQLAKELNMTPIYLYYNTGLHISTNGQQLNVLLEELLTTWSVPIEELVIVSHSMGGLVARSAMYYAEQTNNTWISYLKKIAFLGSPHHGSPLEQIGNYIHQTFAVLPYLQPFARLAKTRSAGITDLRFGNLVEEDWATADRFENHTDTRKPIPLPTNIQCYTIVAAMGKQTDSLVSQWAGDGLVPLESALGQHPNPTKNLAFAKENTLIVYEINHLNLLNDPQVYEQLKKWLL